jgi:hypothetical protein
MTHAAFGRRALCRQTETVFPSSPNERRLRGETSWNEMKEEEKKKKIPNKTAEVFWHEVR